MQAVIARSHEHWKDLMSGKEAPGEINRNQTSDADDEDTYVPSWWASLKFHIPLWPRRLPAAAIPDEYQQWYYLDDDFDPIDQ